MTNRRKDPHDDELDAFLEGKSELSQLLQALPQPAPSAELDAAILARIAADLAANDRRSHSAANDAIMPGAGKATPHFLQRWRAPLALAASVICALLVLMRWQTGPASRTSIVIAQAPQPAASASTMPADAVVPAPPAALPQAAPSSAAITEGGAGAGKSAAAQPRRRQDTAHDKPEAESPAGALPPAASKETSPPQLARALIPDDLPARATVPAPAPATAMPQAAGVPAPANPEKAQAWIALIEELLKVDLRQDALTEWEKFRQAYPRYPVPEKLESQIKALKK